MIHVNKLHIKGCVKLAASLSTPAMKKFRWTTWVPIGSYRPAVSVKFVLLQDEF